MTVNDCAVGRMDVLCAGHEDGLVPCLVKGLCRFLEAAQANLIVTGIIIILAKEIGEGGDSFLEKFERGGLYSVEAGKSVWEGVGGMGAADAIVEGCDQLGGRAEPKVTSGSVGVGRGLKAVTEEFFNPTKGRVSNSTLGIFREINDLEGGWDGNGMGSSERFSDGDGEIPIGDGNGRFGDVRNVGI